MYHLINVSEYIKVSVQDGRKGSMALARYSPLRSMLSRWPIWDDEDFGMLNTTATNNLDIYETEEEVVIKANVAGVPADDIDITFEEGVLWVKAEKQHEEEDENRQHYARSSWSYSYKVAVPGMIDYAQEPKLDLSEGILTVTFKKSEASKPKKLRIGAQSKGEAKK
jgi:HSP20 family protein